MTRIRAIPLSILAVAAALVLAFGEAAAGDSALSGTAQHFTLSGKTLVVANLAGEIRVEGGAGPAYEIDVAVQGDPEAVKDVKFKTDEGEAARLCVQYPFAHENRFIYPAMGRGSNSSIRISRGFGAGSWTKWVLPEHRRGKVEIRGSGRGVQVWADVVVKVPTGRRIEIYQGAGMITAEGFTGSALLNTHNGPIKARGITGDIEIDTGSGNVDAAGIKGSLSIDTGSGRVTLSDCSGERISIDTGSGEVDAEGVECAALKIDTGSGEVTGRSIKANEALIDTGAGSIELALDRMGAGPYRLDTGTGAIDFKLPADASATLTADTGAGGIHLDVSGAKVRHLERTEAALVLGAGEAKVQLDTGSGSITIRQ